MKNKMLCKLAAAFLCSALIIGGCGGKENATDPETTKAPDQTEVTLTPAAGNQETPTDSLKPTEALEATPVARVTTKPTPTLVPTKAPVKEVNCNISLMGDNVKEIEMSGDNVLSFVCVDEKGNEIKMVCHKVTKDEDNQLVFAPGGWICNITPLHGFVDHTFRTDSDSEKSQLGWNYAIEANSQDVKSESDLLWSIGFGIYAKDVRDAQYDLMSMMKGEEPEYIKVTCSVEPMRMEYMKITYIPDKISTEKTSNMMCKISLKDGNITDIVKNGNFIKSFVVNDTNGNQIKVLCKDVTTDENNRFVIRQGGFLATATRLKGIKRISCSDPSGNTWATLTGGYSRKNDVASLDEIYYSLGGSRMAADSSAPMEFVGAPGYAMLSNDVGPGNLVVEAINITYDGVTGADEFSKVYLDTDFYGFYSEGDLYDFGRERWNKDEAIFNFYLVMVPGGVEKEMEESCYVYGTNFYEIGELFDAVGKKKDKTSDALKPGDQLEVTIDDTRYMVSLPVYPQFVGNTLYESVPYANWKSEGDLNILVVPYYYADQKGEASSENLDFLKQCLGRVINADGSITTYAPEKGKTFSLSEYFDLASYGKLKINSFVTDWKMFNRNFYGEAIDQDIREEEVEEINRWVVENYADKLKLLDADNNGLFDAVILVCAPPKNQQNSYMIISNNGAFQRTPTYGTEKVSKNGTPSINSFAMFNERMMFERQNPATKTADTGTMIHEFSHGFGLIDYYDVYYSGLNAVGGYDMQSDNSGDWNVYSKLAVGWADPVVVSPAEIEEKGSVELTISSFADTGSCILIPTAKTEITAGQTMSPFREYLAIELFTPTGAHKYGAQEYGLGKVEGVRIYHINGKRLVLDLTDEIHGTPYSIGVETKTNAYNEDGMFQVEVIQKGGTNNFGSTKKYREINASDFFYAGDSFSMKKHAAFFVNGKMDDGSEFPYTITVKSIKDGKATIVISK